MQRFSRTLLWLRAEDPVAAGFEILPGDGAELLFAYINGSQKLCMIFQENEARYLENQIPASTNCSFQEERIAFQAVSQEGRVKFQVGKLVENYQ